MALGTRRDRDGRTLFDVRVAPRASRDALAGEHDGAVKIAVTAPPVDGAANEAVRKVLAKALGVPKRAVTIVGGQRSKRKTVAVEGVTPGDVQEILER